MDQISYFKKIFKSTKFTNLAWILSHRNIRYNILKHKHYAILKNLLFHGKREVWARSTEGRGRYTIKPAKQTIAWLQGRRTYRKDKTLLHVFFININNQYMYLQICGISIFASKSSTAIFILKQTHSKHTYKGIEREFWSDWQIQNILSHIYIIYFKLGIHLYSYAPTCIRSRCKDQPRWERALPYLRHAAEGLDWFIWQWIIRLSRSWYRTKYLRYIEIPLCVSTCI